MIIDQLSTTIIPKISLMVKIITKWRELRELKREKLSFSLSVSFLQFPTDYEKALLDFFITLAIPPSNSYLYPAIPSERRLGKLAHYQMENIGK